MPSAYIKVCSLINLINGRSLPLAERRNAMRKSNNKGFTLVEIMIVVAIIGLLAAIAIPSFVKNRNLAQKNRCINNLRMIDAAKQQAAVEHGWIDSTDCDTEIDDVNAYIKGGTPVCPSGGTYTYGVVSNNPTCSFGNGHELSDGGN